jgi:hypothetical protein
MVSAEKLLSIMYPAYFLMFSKQRGFPAIFMIRFKQLYTPEICRPRHV